jgi:pimeloyl-ACP methyl ester carboxylesterase
VVYDNPAAGNRLAGTLTLPRTAAPHPAVLLITGSGQQDRNEALLGHKPFLVLADYLTRRGIAVLRVDDRGVGGSTGEVAKATSADFATDVRAGVAYLKQRKDIDARRVGLIGHSEGGMIAPMVAAGSKDVAFIVLMAGTGVPGEEILYEQSALILKANGASEAAIARNRAAQEKMYAIAKTEKDDAVAARKVREILRQLAASPVTGTAAKGEDAAAEAQVKMILSPWFRYFLAFDPRPTLRKVRCPVLAINGEKDLQVPPKANLPAIRAALKAGGNRDHTEKELPGLNHLFQACKTGSPTEYSQIEETFNPAALQAMGDWIVAQVTSDPRARPPEANRRQRS